MKTPKLFDPNLLKEDFEIVKSELYINKEKSKDYFFCKNIPDSFFKSIKENHNYEHIEQTFSEFNCYIGKVNILGEYLPTKKEIYYYPIRHEYTKIVKIHERYHAIHHLLEDEYRDIWNEFSTTEPFYLEFLAQLFTYIFIRDYTPSLLKDFAELNKKQPFIYQTYKIFADFTQIEARSLYIAIREKNVSNKHYQKLKEIHKIIKKKQSIIINAKIEDALINGIRKTIIRFRKRPLNYFTESDIHSSLMKDIMKGSSNVLLYRDTISNIEISLLHTEYPTNFKFSRKEYEDNSTDNEDIIKRRGNFDLVILDPFIIEKIKNDESFLSFLKTIIAKDIQRYEEVHEKLDLLYGEEILYAVEVKFIHFNNLGESVYKQVNVDNKKLESAKNKNPEIKPIILIFCYYSKENETKKENFISENLKNNPVPNEILNIYIEVNIDNIGKKETIKPIWIYNCSSSVPQWVKKITKNYTKANDI